jgi:hypothetical protein
MAFKPATQIESRPNFSSLLDEAPTEVKFAPPIPPGSYVAVVQPAWTKDVNQRGNEFHEFQFKLQQPFEDVDADELKAWISAHGPISEKVYKRRFFITPEAIPYLDEFHQACGVKLQKGVSRLLRNDEVGNCLVGVYMKHRPFTDGSGKVAVDVDRFFKVEEN